MVQGQRYFYGTGRRKCAIARVRIYPGSGNATVNGKPMAELWTRRFLQSHALAPLQAVGQQSAFNVVASVNGGGMSGQAGAIRHGVARALVKASEEFKLVLRRGGYLTRDPRVKERKKYGLKRARKAPQYTKR